MDQWLIDVGMMILAMAFFCVLAIIAECIVNLARWVNDYLDRERSAEKQLQDLLDHQAKRRIQK